MDKEIFRKILAELNENRDEYGPYDFVFWIEIVRIFAKYGVTFGEGACQHQNIQIFTGEHIQGKAKVCIDCGKLFPED